MVDQRLAESHPAVGVVGRDFLRADAPAKPAHAVGEPCRRKADLGILEPLAGIAEHLVSRHPQVVDGDLGMAAGHRAVDRVRHPGDLDRRIGQVDEEHAGPAVAVRVFGLGHHDPDLRALGSGDEALLTIDDPVVAVFAAGGDHHRRVRARAVQFRRFGHEESRARAALDQRGKEALFEVRAADLADQIHVALVGRLRVAG